MTRSTTELQSEVELAARTCSQYSSTLACSSVGKYEPQSGHFSSVTSLPQDLQRSLSDSGEGEGEGEVLQLTVLLNSKPEKYPGPAAGAAAAEMLGGLKYFLPGPGGQQDVSVAQAQLLPCLN